jgi:cytochrome c-type biogenesis protein CcmH
MVRLLLIVIFALAAVLPARAVQPDEVLADPALEQRARELSADLRCLVCQNQSIDDSDAPLARDLRLLLRERLKAGETDKQVIDYLVSRYGEFILLKPRFSAQTFALWLGPFLILLFGIWKITQNRRAKAQAKVEQPLSAEEAEKFNKLINPDE